MSDGRQRTRFVRIRSGPLRLGAGRARRWPGGLTLVAALCLMLAACGREHPDVTGKAPATAAPTPPPVTMVTRSLTAFSASEPPCAQLLPEVPCDRGFKGRWQGNLGSWQELADDRHQPLPDEDAVLADAVELRLRAGDPATRIALAKQLNAPAILLTAAWYLPRSGQGASPAADIQVELANLGPAAADLGGAIVADDWGEALIVLPAVAPLPPDGRCRLTTGPTTENPCPFAPARVAPLQSARAGSAPLTLQSKDGERLDTLRP